MSAPRVALIGPRRLRQGLGPFVARELVAAGAAVTAFVCSRPESVPPAREALRALGVESRGFHRLEDLLDSVEVDAVAILSPPETHAAYLEAAATAGLHALCEKPLVWGGSSPGQQARRCVEAFRVRGLLLVENCQWPDTLASFEELHPGALGERPEQFSMRLSPSGEGESMLVDSLSHPLSLLQAWLPVLSGEDTNDDRVENASLLEFEESGAPAIEIRFDFLRGALRVPSRVQLVRQQSQPRRAGYALNARRAERVVEMSDYSMFFRDGERRVAMADPLATRMECFVDLLRGCELRGQTSGPPPAPKSRTSRRVTTADELVARVQMLEALVAAYRATTGATAKRNSI
ncbi:MAG: Gfo/Idh/MocA family oxidoreductase [Myxococcales bacterium]|nr:Gfo/Idh/MocA family oxidoreductase [Myxococcales bacterium]